MAPSPAAGKTGGAPRTPTKLGKPAPKKLGTPKAAGANKPEAESPSLPQQQSQDDTKEASDDPTEQVKDAPEEASNVEMQDTPEDDDDEGPTEKVSGATDDLSEQAPQPIDESEDAEAGADDTTEGAEEEPEEEEEEAGEQEEEEDEDDDDNATQKAGDTADDEQETTDEGQSTTEGTQKSGGGLMSGAKGLAGRAQDLAGKSEQDPSTAPDDVKESAEGAADDVEDGAEGAKETADGDEDEAEDVTDEADVEEPDVEDAAEGTQETAEDAGDEVADDAEEAAEVADDDEPAAADVADGEEAEEVADGEEPATADVAADEEPATAEAADGEEPATAEAEDAQEPAQATAEDAQETAEDAQETAEDAQDTAEGAQATAEDAAKDAQEGAEESVQETGPDLSILKGLEVNEEGNLVDSEGKVVGRLAEGDVEDLVGYTVGDDGEILDDDGDLVGRCELTPEALAEQEAEKKAEAGEADGEAEGAAEDAEEGEVKEPGLEILKGLTCGVDGLIYNDDGDAVGMVTEGNPEELQGYELNDNGEFLDEDGDVIGYAKLHPEYVEQVVQEQEQEAAEDAAEDDEKAAEDQVDGVDGAADEAGPAVDGAPEDAEGAAEEAGPKADEEAAPELPGVEALEGMQVNEEGQVVDDGGNVLGQLAEGDVEDVQGLQVNDQGEVVDEEGNVLGKVELAEGAAEQLQEAQEEEEAQQEEEAGEEGEEEAGGLPALDLRILEGTKVNKKGKIIDSEGEEIGHLVSGDAKQCAGKKVNDRGEVVDKDGNVLGRVEVTPGEGADEAMNELRERLGINPEEPTEEAKSYLPGLATLDGLKVNKKGQILNEDGEPVGELVDGELTECAGQRCNNKGEVLDDEGNVIGRVKTVRQELEEGEEVPEDAQPEEGEEAAEEVVEEAGEEVAPEEEEVPEEVEDDGLPPLSTLEGLACNKVGKLVNDNGVIVGELIEGDAKKLSKSGITADDQGQFWDNKGHVIGRAKTVPIEDPDDEAPFAGLEGLIVNKDGMVEDENENIVGQVVEGDYKKLVGRSVDEDGDILDKKGNIVGHAERYEEPEAEAEPEVAPIDYSEAEGKVLNKEGYVIGDEGVPVARLIEGNAKELAGKKVDGEGQIWNDSGKVIGRVEMIPVDQREARPEGPFAGLEGLRVIQDGQVADEDGNVVGEIVEGNPKRLIGLKVDEDGDIIDKYGNIKGHAEPLPDEEEEAPPDLSELNGLTLNKQGLLVNQEGIPVGRLVEGNVGDLAGRKSDGEGQIHNDTGEVVGRCELIPREQRQQRPEGPFSGYQGLHVVKDGLVEDEDGNAVGQLVEGDPKRLVGHVVDEDGDILDRNGNVKGHAEPLPEEEEPEPEDLSILDGLVLNKQGYLVTTDGRPMGRLVEGNLGDLAGRKSDGEGLIYNDTGKVAGRCELIPEGERVQRPEGPFAGYDGLHVVKGGMVEDEDGNTVGQLVEGDPKKLVGHQVDEDGDILDKYGNVKGHAEPYEEEEQPEVDLSALAGCTVNKAGNVVDGNGTILGRVAEGDPSTMIGKKVDGQGQIWDNAGNVIGRAELVTGADTKQEGPFAGFDGAVVAKDGFVYTPSGDIIGQVIEGDVKKLVGHTVDEDGDINDKNGNTIGKAQRYDPEEKERRINPMSGRRVNKEGNVVDEDGNVMGRLTAGDLGHCVGLEIDDNGYVIDNDGNKVGEVTLLENIIEEEEEEVVEETEEERLRREESEIADKMANICQQTLERVQPVCKQIKEFMDKADRTPREELDEEQLVNDVKPLIEEGGRILQECNGSLRGLDPDGHIAAQAKGRANTREATPEEYRLADVLKELTSTVVTTIDDAKKKLNDMPHAKKKLNPLWGLLTQPLFQILAAVGLLLTGVLGLVGQLLNGLGLGGLVNGLLGGLGIDKLLNGLGLGSVTGALGGGKDKKKSGGGMSSLPLVGGLFGSK